MVTYVGAVIRRQDQVLLRKLDKHGYVWTFPRSALGHGALIDAVSDLAGSFGHPIRYIRPIPGTWTTSSSRAQYWFAEVDDVVPIAAATSGEAAARAVAAFGVDPPPPEWIALVHSLDAAGLPIEQIGRPFPLGDEDREFVLSFAAGVGTPVPDEPTGRMIVEWVPAAEVADRLLETRDAKGRERDRAVWVAALAAAGSVKPTDHEIGVEKRIRLIDGKGRSTSHRVSDNWQGVTIEFTPKLPFAAPSGDNGHNWLARAVVKAASGAGYRVEACWTCRHSRQSGGSNQDGLALCWAGLELNGDQRRFVVPCSLSLCPRFEASIVPFDEGG